MGKKKNLLVICSDEHNGKILGCLNHPFVKTPNLDKLASQGTCFTNAYCNSPVCTPSRMSFITGKYTHQISSWHMGMALDEKEMTWAKKLSDNGIKSTMLGKMDFCGPYQSGGFSDYKIIQRRQQWKEVPCKIPFNARLKGYTRKDKRAHILNAGIREDVVTDGKNGSKDTLGYYDHDRIVTQWAIDYLKEKISSNQPWALYVGLLYPHWPFCVPKKYFDMYYKNVDLPIDMNLDNPNLHPLLKELQVSMQLDGITNEQVRTAVATYYGMITCMDDMVGEILNQLEIQGLTENTNIIYTSDHGELIGEHGLFYKQCPYDGSSKIPLIIKGEEFLANKKNDTIVSLVDMYPTIMEMFGLECESDRVGQSWLPLLNGEKRENQYAFSEYHGNFFTQDWYMLRDEKYKYIHYQNRRASLFDMKNDPDEMNDLVVNSTVESDIIIEKMEKALQKIANTEEVSLKAKTDLGLIGENGEDYTETLSYEEFSTWEISKKEYTIKNQLRAVNGIFENEH
ncbi:MAG: sulfatase-like hydrolase/transferase [Clostridia bacterium]